MGYDNRYMPPLNPRLERKKRSLNLHSCVTAIDRISRRRFGIRRHSLDAENERLAALSKDSGSYLHPTKGRRTICPARLKAQGDLTAEPYGAPIWRKIFKTGGHVPRA